MASSTITPFTCLSVAEWRPNGLSSQALSFGVLSEDAAGARLSAKFNFGDDATGPYAAIHLEFLPSTVSDEYEYLFPDQTISIVIAADNIHSISQTIPGMASLPTYVKAQCQKYVADMRKQGISNGDLKQTIRLDLTLDMAPVILMPKHARNLTNAGVMKHLHTLKSLSRMTSFALFVNTSDKMIKDLRQFRIATTKINLGGSFAAMFNKLTHFSFSEPDDAHWSRYRVQQHTIASSGQKRALQDNHDNSQENQGSHGAKRTRHDGVPSHGSGRRLQSEPPIQNSGFGQAAPQSFFTSGTATLKNTQAGPSAMPNTESQAGSVPNIFNRGQAHFTSSEVQPFGRRAFSVIDGAPREGSQDPTSATTESFATSITKLRIKSTPVRPSNDNQKSPTVASPLTGDLRVASSAGPLCKFPTLVTWRPDAMSGPPQEFGSIESMAAGDDEVVAHIKLGSDLSNTCAAIHLVTRLETVSDNGSATREEQSISLVISMDNIDVFEHQAPSDMALIPSSVQDQARRHQGTAIHGGGSLGRVFITMKGLPLVIMPRYPRPLLKYSEFWRITAFKSLSGCPKITLYYIKNQSNDASVCAFRDAFQNYKGGAFPTLSDTATHCVFSGPEDDRWKQYQVETGGITDSEQAQTVSSKKKKKYHPPRRRYRPGNGEDGNDPKLTGETSSANGSSATVSLIKTEQDLPNHTSFCPVLHPSSTTNSSSVIAAGTQVQSTPTSSQQLLSPDELVRRWRAYHDWAILSSANFGVDTMLDMQGILSGGLRAARAGDALTFAAKMADIFMLVDENKEHQG